MFGKLALVNVGVIICLILAYYFKQFLSIFISNANVTITILCFLIIIILAIYFYLSYRILLSKQKVTADQVTFDGKKIETIHKYIALLTEYIQKHTYTFKKEILNNIKACESFIKKRDLLFSTLQSFFNKTELSYLKFMSIINGIENSFAATINNILIRLNAFDEREYEDIFRKKKVESDNLEKRQKIFDDYVEFMKTSSDYLDEILIKLDQLQLEISKLSVLDYNDIENNELIKEINVLIKTMKLYK